MKAKVSLVGIIGLLIVTSFIYCGKEDNGEKMGGGMGSVSDEGSQKNIVEIAKGSKDHTTLVTAVVAGDRVDSLANPGPFTVFAPTNAAFEKLPKGTVEGLLERSKIEALQNVLEYHVFIGVLKAENLKDGDVLGMANGNNITISIKDSKPVVNGTSNIIASIPASNGMIHVVDTVLLPPN
ncbi:MAG: fasciclin domain-containing protein [Leptospiraceae bacterium]|nr:fasciclin domain-containing protein [Leptospiraceae bacterium]